MTRPDDIPQDVWGAAQRLFNQIDPEGAMPRNPMPDLARAILAERNRCWCIVDNAAWDIAEDDDDTVFMKIIEKIKAEASPGNAAL